MPAPRSSLRALTGPTCGKLHAAQYWVANEVPRVELLARRIAAGDDASLEMPPEGF